jgi:hypothetical protein
MSAHTLACNKDSALAEPTHGDSTAATGDCGGLSNGQGIRQPVNQSVVVAPSFPKIVYTASRIGLGSYAYRFAGSECSALAYSWIVKELEGRNTNREWPDSNRSGIQSLQLIVIDLH